MPRPANRWTGPPHGPCVGPEPQSLDHSGTRPPEPGILATIASSPALRKGTSVTIDIDQLSEAELIDLNNRIVARLRFLQQMRAHVEMLEFKIGDRVSFRPPGHGPVDALQQEDRDGRH